MEKTKPIFSKKELLSAKKSIGNTDGVRGNPIAPWKEELAFKSFKRFEGKNVLDLGSNWGLLFARYLAKHGIKANVTSFSPAFASKRARRYERKDEKGDAAGRRMVAGMGEVLPFKDGAFDTVICHSVLEYLRDSRKRFELFLGEIIRVLARGGEARIYPITLDVKHGDKEKIVIQDILDNELSSAIHGKVRVTWKQIDVEFFTLILRKK